MSYCIQTSLELGEVTFSQASAFSCYDAIPKKLALANDLFLRVYVFPLEASAKLISIETYHRNTVSSSSKKMRKKNTLHMFYLR